MKKFLKILFAFCLLFALISCSKSNKELEKFAGKEFNGASGGSILIILEKENSLFFSGKPVISPNTNLDNVKKDAYEKSKLQTYKNPKIESKDGKKYLTADNFPYKLEIIAENKIKDVDDDYEYTYVDLTK